jgi:serine/threonine-protein kinase
MRDLIGRNLGHYRIIEKIGEGGMGEVYRAHDERLDRDVAIKVLPEQVAGVQDRLERFEREAKLLASFNHPNIATLHGLEEGEGHRFLVMELVEGESLASVIARGAIPLDEAIPIALQISTALEAAHERAIIHRDLKPANVMVDSEGGVKVLDFGLAKAFEPEGSGPQTPESLAESPTLTADLTRGGILLGTAAYMSPEQARGKPVDKRADIWAFGCTCFEMLSGTRPFAGTTSTEVMAAIIKEEPDWDGLPFETAAPVLRLLRRCLVKDPSDRLHDIADARIEIEEALSEPTPQEVGLTVRQPTGWRRTTQWGAGMVVGAVVAGLAFWTLKGEIFRVSRPVSHVVINVEPGQHLWGGHKTEGMAFAYQRPTRTSVALSPDGSYLVYAATTDDARGFEEYSQRGQLFLRHLDQPRARPIPGTGRGGMPFVSPDGKWIGFCSHLAEGGYAIKMIAATGGEPKTILENVRLPYGASWRDGGSIIYSDRTSGGLSQASATRGSAPEQVTTVNGERGETSHRVPHVLPGGKAVLFTVFKGASWDRTEIALHAFDSGQHTVLLEHGADARYVPTGHLVFVRRGVLMAVKFDLKKLKVTGEPVRVLEDVMQAVFSSGIGHNSGAGQYSISGSGSLAYVTGGEHPELNRSLLSVGMDGQSRVLAIAPGEYRYLRQSPDGRRLVFTKGRSGEMDIWVYDLHNQTERRLTFEGGDRAPVWSPDGTRIAFSSNRHSPVINLFWMNVDGSELERLTTSDRSERPSSWSVNGVLAFVQLSVAGREDIWVLPLDEGRDPRPFVATPLRESWPAFSPDGKWLAYASNETDRWEIYVRPYPGPGAPRRVSIDGGRAPVWSRDGREIFYRAPDAGGGYGRRMMVVDVTADHTFAAGKPRQLFEVESCNTEFVRSFDVTPSGEFVMVTPGDQQPQPVTEINLILNWFEELKRLSPTE